MKYKVLIGGMIGVPITFLDKYNPDTGGYELVGLANSARYIGQFECITIISGRKNL